jgi:hypothetical protein
MVSDIATSEMHGCALAKELQSLPEYRFVPMIAVNWTR